MKNLFGLIVLMFCFFGNVAGQEVKTPKLGIINGRATYLPKPEYPPEAKEFCAGGKVEIEVLVNEKGDVIEAKAISGDELLREASVEAVKKAKFTTYNDVGPVKTRGIIVYNFDSLAPKCLDVGTVNNKAIKIPKPKFPKNYRCVGIVKVEVIIDVLSGKVTNARAISGHPLLRIAAAESAKKAAFYPAMINSKPIFAKGLLVYNFSANGKVKF